MFSYSPGVYNPPNSFYTQLDITLNDSEICQLIGKNGCNFKFLTRVSNSQYIWWNKSKNIIEIWGNHYYLLSAKVFIQKYIQVLIIKVFDEQFVFLIFYGVLGLIF